MSFPTNGGEPAKRLAQDAPADPIRASARSTALYTLALIFITIIVYCRLFHASFAGLDDDIHVYQNPYLNPPTVDGILHFWRHPYESLYVPLAYTVFGIIAHFASIPATFVPSVGDVVHVDAGYFHTANIFLHVINVCLAFALLRRLVKNEAAAFAGALVFAIHPLQVESVAWISELRGQLCSLFSLLALLSYVRSRDSAPARPQWGFYAAALLLTVCALLSKPSAVTIPLAACAIDLIMLGGSWRATVARVVPWLLITAPFVLITRNVQPIPGDAATAIWQRPFIAGDAIAFYIAKVFVPIKLAIIYGRKPQLVLHHWWGYVTILFAATVKLASYYFRKVRPRIWLGWLLFSIFVLPELGLIPFAYQHFSTVADRYIYLSMLGVGLILADLLTLVDMRKLVIITAAICIPLAALTWVQTGYWQSTATMMNHDLAIDPHSDTAYNNRGMMELGNKQYAAAISDFQNSIACLPSNDQAMVNLGKAYVETGRPADALAELRAAVAINPDNATALSDMGSILLDMGRVADGLSVLQRSCLLDPDDPILRYNYAYSLSIAGHGPLAIQNYQEAISMAPGMPQAHIGLGVAFANAGDIPNAMRQFEIALILDPSNKDAANDLTMAKSLISRQTQP
jgi:protein O-mannosyl-transferase